MLRRLLIFAVVAPLAAFAVCLLLTGSNPVSSNPDLPWGDFWRLPWRADASRNVDSGNGYGQNTHAAGLDYWALDFQVPNGDYVMAVQEGIVTDTDVGVPDECDPNGHYGIYVVVTDSGGFNHLYGHFSARFVDEGDRV